MQASPLSKPFTKRKPSNARSIYWYYRSGGEDWTWSMLNTIFPRRVYAYLRLISARKNFIEAAMVSTRTFNRNPMLNRARLPPHNFNNDTIPLTRVIKKVKNTKKVSASKMDPYR